MSNMQIMIKADVLGTPVDGVYLKDAKAETLDLTDNPKTPCTLNKHTTLVYGAPHDPKKLTITKLVTELGTLFTGGFVEGDTIEKALPENLKAKMNEIGFSVRMIYYTKVSATLTANGKDKKKNDALKSDLEEKTSEASKLIKSNEKDSEYAVWIDVHISEDLLKDFPIKISELSFKIWSTENQKILDEMEITKVKELLEGAGIGLPDTE